jgi:hypothetical protein
MINNDFYGDRFRWFVGVVKDVGGDRSRVRVRIFGIHHTEDTSKVADDDLPWALVIYPTTGGQTSGGTASHGLVPGTWVVGFFVDAEDSQQPIVLGVINGGEGSMNNSPGGTGAGTQGGSSPGSSTGAGQGTSTPNPNGTTTANAPGATASGPTTGQLSGSDNEQKVYNYFWERIKKEAAYTGDIKCIVAAITGHVANESRCDPQAKNGNDWNKEEGSKASYGIAQWREGKYDRYGPMLRFCGVETRVQPPNLPSLEKQLDFMWHEFHTSEKSGYNRCISAATLEDAMVGVYMTGRGSAWQKINGTWIVNRSEGTFKNKMDNARRIFSSKSYTGNAV